MAGTKRLCFGETHAEAGRLRFVGDDDDGVAPRIRGGVAPHIDRPQRRDPCRR